MDISVIQHSTLFIVYLLSMVAYCNQKAMEKKQKPCAIQVCCWSSIASIWIVIALISRTSWYDDQVIIKWLGLCKIDS